MQALLHWLRAPRTRYGLLAVLGALLVLLWSIQGLEIP